MKRQTSKIVNDDLAYSKKYTENFSLYVEKLIAR